jgi:hypothetical protein
MIVRILSTFSIFCLAFTCACVFRRNDHPPLPQSVSGWEKRVDNGYEIIGDLVIHKGQPTSNGKLSVNVLEIKQDNGFVGTGQAWARIEFRRVSGGKVVCESTFPAYGGGDLCQSKLNEFGIMGEGTRGMNVDDEWAHLMLFGEAIEGKGVK